MAAWLDGVRHAARRGVFALARAGRSAVALRGMADKAYFPYTSARVW
jgi:hypothetical protein